MSKEIDAVNGSHDFWLSCGHHLLDRGADGRLLLTDEFLKAYLARRELTPPPQACSAEREIYRTLLSDPRQPVASSRIAAIADPDAQENWRFALAWRDHLLREATLEASYLAIARERLPFPPLFLNQLVQVILRNVLDGCPDPFMLRAAELFFRAQQLSVVEGNLLACDAEFASSNAHSPLTALLGLGALQGIEVLGEENSRAYWDRSDAFDMALDLTAGRRGLSALGEVASRWIRHLLGVTVTVEAVTELRNASLTWYVGLDSQGTRIGDALWQGEEMAEATRELLVGLFRLTFAEERAVLESARGSPTYLIFAMSPDRTLRMKPQNLITGLPLNLSRSAVN
jgi:Family of unknown function (DUF6352)